MTENGLPSFLNGKRKYLLPDRLPEIFELRPVQLKNINHDIKSYFSPDFFYSGAALLSPRGKQVAKALRENVGKCIGGGVLSSRDLEWYGLGKLGPQPGQYLPEKSFFGYSKTPQSHESSEWIAFEFGLVLMPPSGNTLLAGWDDIAQMEVTLKQGKDLHIKISGDFVGDSLHVNAQANAMGINTLLDIGQIVGVEVRR